MTITDAFNAGERDVISAMRSAGWLNPDGVGVMWGHPGITAPDTGEMIWTLVQTAIQIQMKRERGEMS